MMIYLQILGIGAIVGMIVGFFALLIPSLRIARKAGFHRGWAWLACLLYCGGFWAQLALHGSAGVFTDRRAIADAYAPYVSQIAPLTALVALWCLAFVSWPALRRTTLPGAGSAS